MSLFDSSLPESRATESHNDWTTTTGSPHLGVCPGSAGRWLGVAQRRIDSRFPDVVVASQYPLCGISSANLCARQPLGTIATGRGGDRLCPRDIRSCKFFTTAHYAGQAPFGESRPG